jgi:hypothetical protein
MPYALFYTSPVFDGRDAIVGTRTRRLNDNVYETLQLPQKLAVVGYRCEGFADDMIPFVLDLSTGEPVTRRSFYFQPPSDDCPF